MSFFNRFTNFIAPFNLIPTLEAFNSTMESASKPKSVVAKTHAPQRSAAWERKEKEPDHLQTQLQMNAEMVDKIYSAFGTCFVPIVFEVWIFFVLYILRIPEHRNATYIHIFDECWYLCKYYPRFLGDRKKKFNEMKQFHVALRFYWEICHDDKLHFRLFEDEADIEPSGVYLKTPDSLDAVHNEMKGVAFQVNKEISKALMDITDFHHAMSLISQGSNEYYIITGPITFAQHRCFSPFEPAIKKKITPFSEMNFATESNPGIVKSARWYLSFKIGEDKVVQTSGEKAEFIVQHRNLLPPPKCKGCSKCGKKGIVDYIKFAVSSV
jgi:hypothetical protein